VIDVTCRTIFCVVLLDSDIEQPLTGRLDKTLLDRTVALAATIGGCGARQLRTALGSTPLFGAGRVEDTLNLLGHARRTTTGVFFVWTV
jgi:hypothetical protein